MTDLLLRGHTIPTDWHPIPALGSWPLDHVFVSTAQGRSWGCFGRGLNDDPEARIVCQGYGAVEWADEIAGPDGSAGVLHQVTGVCHCAANRILVPVGVDVHDAPGNEVVVPIFGKYGLGVSAFIDRVKSAATTVNSRVPGLISDAQIELAVSRIMRAKEDEYEILMDDVNDFLRLNAESIPARAHTSLRIIYSDLYEKRQHDYERFIAEKISSHEFVAKLQSNVAATFQRVKELLGQEAFEAVFKMPPDAAVAYLFKRD